MTGNVKNGFVAQFIPGVAGLHVVLVEYNGVAVGGTPFYCKVNCVCSENILSTENICQIVAPGRATLPPGPRWP